MGFNSAFKGLMIVIKGHNFIGISNKTGSILIT